MAKAGAVAKADRKAKVAAVASEENPAWRKKTKGEKPLAKSRHGGNLKAKKWRRKENQEIINERNINGVISINENENENINEI
jgi:hypothetical protein